MSKSISEKIQAKLHPIQKVNIPWYTIHVDITGKLSGKSDQKEYIIVQVDAFTKYVYLYHTLKLVSSINMPVTGKVFYGKFSQFCSDHKINLHLIATDASRANGQVDRKMRTLKNMSTAAETGTQWSVEDVVAHAIWRTFHPAETLAAAKSQIQTAYRQMGSTICK